MTCQTDQVLWVEGCIGAVSHSSPGENIYKTATADAISPHTLSHGRPADPHQAETLIDGLFPDVEIVIVPRFRSA